MHTHADACSENVEALGPSKDYVEDAKAMGSARLFRTPTGTNYVRARNARSRATPDRDKIVQTSTRDNLTTVAPKALIAVEAQGKEKLVYQKIADWYQINR